MIHHDIEIADEDEEYDEDFDFVIPPPMPQDEDFDNDNFDDIVAYHAFVQETFLDSRRKHKATEDEIQAACYPNMRILLISRLESYLAHKIETTSRTMRTMMRAADHEEFETLSIDEGTVRFASFWAAIEVCWEHAEGFRNAMEEHITGMYEAHGTMKVHEKRIWDDVMAFGREMVGALEKELGRYEKATLREIVLREKEARAERRDQEKEEGKRRRSSKLSYEEIEWESQDEHDEECVENED